MGRDAMSRTSSPRCSQDDGNAKVGATKPALASGPSEEQLETPNNEANGKRKKRGVNRIGTSVSLQSLNGIRSALRELASRLALVVQQPFSVATFILSAVTHVRALSNCEGNSANWMEFRTLLLGKMPRPD